MLIPKVLVPAATVAFGLGLAALSPQDGPSQDVTTESKTKTVTVVSDKPERLEDILNDLYVRLRRLRSERLPEKPKQLSDSATKLYRQAIEALDKKDDPKAKALTRAATELTHALELTLDGSDSPADPDLPPPPRRGLDKVFIYDRTAEVVSLPPMIAEDGEVTVTASAEGPAKTVDIKGPIRIELKDIHPTGTVRLNHIETGDLTEKRDVIVERPKGEKAETVVLKLQDAFVNVKGHVDAERLNAQAARAEALKARVEVAKTLRLGEKVIADKPGEHRIELRLEPDGRVALDKFRTAEAHAKLQESLAGVRFHDDKSKGQFHIVESVQGHKLDSGSASSELKRAYEAVTKARKERKKSDDANYLDAARDLYNAARREAEAKRFDRAVALAHAAEALTRADHALGMVRVETVVRGDQKNGFHVVTENIHGAESAKIVVVPGEEKQRKAEILEKLAAKKAGGSEKAKIFAYSVKSDEGKKEGETTIHVVPKPHEGEGDQHKVEVRVVEPKHGDVKKTEKRTVEVRVDDSKHAEARKEVKGFELRLDNAKKVDEPKVEGTGTLKFQLAEPRIVVEGKEIAADAPEGDVQGIGVMIASNEDGKALVQDLIKDGPAGKDGRIKVGDSLVGVVNDKGAIIGFGDKPLGDVTKLLRGAVGTKVKVVVQPKDSNDLKVYEIERKKLEVPKAEAAKPATEDAGAKIPPVID